MFPQTCYLFSSFNLESEWPLHKLNIHAQIVSAVWNPVTIYFNVDISVFHQRKYDVEIIVLILPWLLYLIFFNPSLYAVIEAITTCWSDENLMPVWAMEFISQPLLAMLANDMDEEFFFLVIFALFQPKKDLRWHTKQ